ncbi:helix-turn-helix transcriptional regulator [Streptomyces bacillaris]
MTNASDSWTEAAKKYGRRLRELREQAGLTQEALGKKIPLSKPRISEIEHGKFKKPLDRLHVTKWVEACSRQAPRAPAGPSRSLGEPWASGLQELELLYDGSRAGQHDVGSARARAHVFRSHEAWIKQFVLPDRLQGREEELRELEAFCAAADSEGPSYAWWQAKHWAGKSALMAEFVVRCQRTDVEVVSYFGSDRFGNNDRDSFLHEVCQQLAVIADRDPSPSTSRPEDLPELCQAAAEVCRRRGRRLVLLVDGLDEDRGVGPDGLGIAALLPRNPPLGMRVVVAGRPNPPVPHDVHEDHPLRDPGIVRPLTQSPAARATGGRAQGELQRLLKDQPVGNRLLGLLAVTRGGLTTTDLAKLVDVQPHEISERLCGITGRSFISEDRGHLLGGHAKADSSTYILGHTQLLQAAQDGLGDTAIAAHEKQLHDWADDYRARDWPRDTPPYLLYDYTRMLRLKGDTERLASFVLDTGRQRALLDRGSVDTALTEVELTLRVIEREAPDDLATMAALAAARDMLAGRAGSLPLRIVLAFAELGYSQRAMDLARSSPHPSVKAGRLAEVARALVRTDHGHAAKAAQEAARWAEQARQEAAPSNGDEADAEAAAGEAAVALIAVGQDRQGRELLNSLNPHTIGDDTLPCEMTVEAADAARLRSAALTEELLDQAQERADELASDQPADPTAPIRAWLTVARAAGPERATRLYDRISEYAREFPERLESVDVLAAAASALAADRSDEAATLARRAGQQLRAALRAPESLSDEDSSHLGWFLGNMLTSVTRALVDTGTGDEARALVAAVPETMRVGVFDEDELAGARIVLDGMPRRATKQAPAEALAQQACRLAEQGNPDAAKSRLREAMESFGRSPEGSSMRRSWLTPLAGALAAIGDPAAGERLAGSIDAPGTRAQALAVVSAVCDGAGRSADARRLAHEAADLAAALEGADDYSLLHGAPGIYVSEVKAAAAHALALVGEADRASSLIGGAEDRDVPALRRARLALAAGLRPHSPDTATRLVCEVREGMIADHESRARRLARPDRQHLVDSAWSGLVTEHAELLVAAGTSNRTCRAWLKQALRETFSRSYRARSPQDEMVIVILAARQRPDWARRLLNELQAEVNPYQYPEVPVGCAVAHAVLGDLAAARQAAQNAAPIVRTEALASVAAYLARVPADLLSAVTPPGSDAFGRVLHALALMQTSRNPPDLDQSRRFLRAALAGDGWHVALPTLAHIASDAVTAVRNVADPTSEGDRHASCSQK